MPAWAPPTGELGKVDWNVWFKNNPYAEWYMNTLKFEDSPTRQHHVQTYGKDFDYLDFIPEFNKQIAKWDPNAWAKLFQEVGARYVVLTSKHHDGFTLWPSQVKNPNRPDNRQHADRDLVGELTTAVRAEGLLATVRLMRAAKRPDEADAFLASAKASIAFQLRTQIWPEQAMHFRNPRRSLGGFREDLSGVYVRIDYVQHSLSALLALLHLNDNAPPPAKAHGL